MRQTPADAAISEGATNAGQEILAEMKLIHVLLPPNAFRKA